MYVAPRTHNLCFRAKIRQNVYNCKPQLYYIKGEFKGLYIIRTCKHDEITRQVGLERRPCETMYSDH